MLYNPTRRWSVIQHKIQQHEINDENM